MNLPLKFVERMKSMLGDEYDDFYKAFTTSPIYSGIRINVSKTNVRNTVLSEFGTLEPVPWCKDGFYADKSVISGNHPYHAAGLFYFQEPSAMCAGEGIPINEGDYVLDLCAAPGGKSTQIGAKLHGTGLMISNEIVPNRANILSENIERFGLANIIVTNETPQKLADKYPSFFDKIIVDAPCSGEGMFRKEPQAIDEWSIEHTVSCGTRQQHILDCAAKMLKQGGMILYSTCTFAPQENEIVSAYMIDKGFRLCEIVSLDMLSNGKTEWSNSQYDMSMTKRIFPHLLKGEGHFAALFKKEYSDGENKAGESYPSKKRKQTKKSTVHPIDSAIKLFREFEKDFLNTSLDSDFVLFGDNLYLKPKGIDIDKIKVVRCGLYLGIIKKGRFEPAHALVIALTKNDFKHTLDIPVHDERMKAYLMGNTLSYENSGWCAVCVDGYPIGWGKASGGILKNHYPKYLRLKR